MPVVWRARALTDIGRITAFVAAENPAAAVRIGQELLLAGESLATFPDRGRPGGLAGIRELVAMHPYLIVYRTAADTVTILRIWHAAQDRQ